MTRLALLFAIAAAAFPQGLDWVKANYTKYEYRVPMRDGVKLFTSVYLPKDPSQTWPMMLMRTPYGVAPYGVDQYRDQMGTNPWLARDKYIFVFQDVRGTRMSEGQFINMTPHKDSKSAREFDESTDTYDTIDWLVRHLPNNNARVCTWGSSYPGFYTAAGMIDAHPAHKCAIPQAPIMDWFTGDDFHHNGALFLPHAFNFLASFGRPRPEPRTTAADRFDHQTPDGYDFFLRLGPLLNANEKYFKNDVAFWNDIMKNDTYTEFWKARNLRPHVKGVKPAVLTVGGWFDAENLYGALQLFKTLEKQSPTTEHTLVMGPWCHGCWYRSGTGEQLGDIRFNDKTGPWYQEHVELPFVRKHLKSTGDWKHAKTILFETGTNQWRRGDTWPPANAQPRTLYARANGILSFDAPTETSAFDEYVSDPAKPVPYIDKTAPGMMAEYMTADQRFASRRPDVITYMTAALDEDLTIAGDLTHRLWVSTTGTDSDFIVKLVDVYPDRYPDPEPNPTKVRMGGYQQLIRGEVMRGKFREGFEKPVPFAPGQATPVEFTVNDVFHTFRTGHRVMMQIQSTWFPLVDRNPQQFLNINLAKETDFRQATQRIFRSRTMPTQMRFRVMPEAPQSRVDPR